MNFKKFAKLFMLFTLMNLIGTVVWASENNPDSAGSCESMSDVKAKAVAPAAASTASQSTATSTATAIPR